MGFRCPRSAFLPDTDDNRSLFRFRLGLFLYVPVYVLVPELRALIKVEGETKLVFLGMVVLTSIRYLANACAYTAVMVLINVLTPPEYVPLANGLAQSCVSFARFLGKRNKLFLPLKTRVRSLSLGRLMQFHRASIQALSSAEQCSQSRSKTSRTQCRKSGSTGSPSCALRAL